MSDMIHMTGFSFLSRPSLCPIRERCGVIKIRQPAVQRHWRERETVFQNGPAGLRRLTRKRYIDLGNPTRSDFDTVHQEISMAFRGNKTMKLA